MKGTRAAFYISCFRLGQQSSGVTAKFQVGLANEPTVIL